MKYAVFIKENGERMSWRESKEMMLNEEQLIKEIDGEKIYDKIQTLTIAQKKEYMKTLSGN